MIRTFDIGRMLQDILEAGVTLRDLADRLETADISAKLLKHYVGGGMPNLPRGHLIIAMWSEATQKPESEAPMRGWSPAYRIAKNSETHAMRPHCAACGQVLRGQARVESWQQLQLHHGQYGDPETVPSWLAPRPVQHAEFQGRSRRHVVEDETTGSAS